MVTVAAVEPRSCGAAETASTSCFWRGLPAAVLFASTDRLRPLTCTQAHCADRTRYVARCSRARASACLLPPAAVWPPPPTPATFFAACAPEPAAPESSRHCRIVLLHQCGAVLPMRQCTGPPCWPRSVSAALGPPRCPAAARAAARVTSPRCCDGLSGLRCGAATHSLPPAASSAALPLPFQELPVESGCALPLPQPPPCCW
mmetsp:Transcript_13039/g.39501  ORF Transcript_13039/g.39501 Transcript_13039/m.39501 type:complete len:203 (+) Transcript_13039:736-1344(+)